MIQMAIPAPNADEEAIAESCELPNKSI